MVNLRRMAAGLIFTGVVGFGVTGLQQHAASAVSQCWTLSTGFESPDKTSKVTFVNGDTGLDFSTNSGVRVLTLVLHVAGGGRASFDYTASGGRTSGTDVHATPRAVITSYDICKDEPPFSSTTTGATTTTTTVARTTTTVAPTTTTAVGSTTVVTEVSTTVPPSTTTTTVAPALPTTVAPTTPTVLPTTVVPTTRPPELPATGQGIAITTYLALASMLIGSALLLVSRRRTA